MEEGKEAEDRRCDGGWECHTYGARIAAFFLWLGLGNPEHKLKPRKTEEHRLKPMLPGSRTCLGPDVSGPYVECTYQECP